ncbi:hypothetical protein LCGC14_1912120 [marine sediment metagenome]|uniref:Phosphoserine phosphatase n=1 Tax=marine sediment metagenome TaxID=412755 RepID=A0A0F9I798_9ZZZZ
MSRERTYNTQTSRISFRDLEVQIEDLRQKRDGLNDKTKKYISDLQENETEIINSLKIAREKHKKKRDYWNNKVKQLKEKKIEYIKLLDNFIEEKKKKVHNNKDNKQIISVKQIERKIDNLERIIETEKLDITEENAIIDKIRKFAEMKQRFFSEQKNTELYKIERKIEIVKINLNKIYEQLNKWSNKSQENHSKMLEMFQNVDELKENKKRIEEELIENKKKADSYHEQYLKLLNQRKKTYKGKKPYKPNKKLITKIKQKTIKYEMIQKIQQDKLAMALEKQKAGKKLNLFEARLILEQSEK